MTLGLYLNKLSEVNSTRTRLTLFGFAVTIKVILLFFLVSSCMQYPPIAKNFYTPIVCKSGDYIYFLKPVDNYFETGYYSYSNNAPFAGRMPGYWLIYWILRSFFDLKLSLNLLIVSQILTSSFATIVIADAAKLLFKKERVFWIAYFFAVFNLYTLSHDIQTQSESFAVSAMIFFLYFFIKFIRKVGSANFSLLFAGLFLTWAIFLRPFLGVVLPLCGLFIILYSDLSSRKSWAKTLRLLLCFTCTFIGAESLWIARNYFVLDEIIPLEQNIEKAYGKLYSAPWIQIRRMIIGFGENAAYFEPNTLAEWFKSTDTLVRYKFKLDVYRGLSFNSDSMLEIKKLYLKYNAESDPLNEKSLSQRIVSTARRYEIEYKTMNPVQYYLKNPAKRLCLFVFNSGSSYLLLPPFQKQSVWQKVLKIIASGYYYLTLALSFSLFFIRKKKDEGNYMLVLLSIVLSIFLVISLFSDIQENRYFMPVFPVAIIFAAGSLGSLLTKRKFRAESQIF